MANTVYTTHEYELDNGKVIVLKPLVIARMRKFMEIIDERFPACKDINELNDCLVDAAVVCLEKHNPDVVKDIEDFKDNIDMETLYKILEVCGGVKLNDPNLVRTLAEAAESLQSDGQI